MSNQYAYNSGTSATNYSSQYSPPLSNGSMTMGVGNGANTSPTFNNTSYGSVDSTGSSGMSSLGSLFTSSSNYSFHNARMRCYLSKSFDIEDDMEFCPDIPEQYSTNSPPMKKFNAHTAMSFSPTTQAENMNNHQHNPQSPRVTTPRLKKPLEIINPQTRMRVGSPAMQNK